MLDSNTLTYTTEYPLTWSLFSIIEFLVVLQSFHHNPENPVKDLQTENTDMSRAD